MRQSNMLYSLVTASLFAFSSLAHATVHDLGDIGTNSSDFTFSSIAQGGNSFAYSRKGHGLQRERDVDLFGIRFGQRARDKHFDNVRPVPPVTVNAPVTPVTVDTPVTPVTADTPVTPVTADTPVTPVTADTPVTPVTADTPITPVTVDTPVAPVTAEIPVTADVPVTTITPVTAPVPEPETYAMILAGLALIGFTARRRNRVA